MSEAAKGVDAENPWLGLTAFTEELCEYFYGRDDEVAELVRRVKRKTLTVLFGQSGLGKTSLLQAGLFPKLRHEKYLPVYIRLDFSPHAAALAVQVKERIAETIHSAELASFPAAKEGEALWEYFHRRGADFRLTNGDKVVPLLVFDQFEEAFTIGNAAGSEVLSTFVTELSDLVENRAPALLEARFEKEEESTEQYDFSEANYRVLLSLREDYLPHLEGLRATMPSLMLNRMRLTRMNGEQAFNAVRQPGGDLVSAEVAQQIVAFVAGAGSNASAPAIEKLEVEPSLLSLVCHELNAKRRAAGYPAITADLLAGSSGAILQDFYERSLADQIPPVRSFVEDELLTEAGFRENIALDRARKQLEKRGAPPGAIDVLVDRRLLRVEERLNVRRIELTHDILTGVVRTSRDSRRAREEKLEAEARQAEAESQRRQAEQREQISRARLRQAQRRVAAIAALLVLALITAAWALIAQFTAKRERARADEARKRATASEALAQLNFYDAQIGRAQAAWKANQIGKAQSLLATLRPSSGATRDYRGWEWYYLSGLCDAGSRVFLGHRNYVNSVAFSSDGRFVLSGSGDTTAKLWAADGGYVIRTFGRKDDFTGVGIVFERDAQFNLLITEALPGSPAADVGLQRGDRIIKIADAHGTLVEVAKQADTSLLGGEAGTTVKIEVLPAGATESRVVEVERRHLVFNSGHPGRLTSAIFTPDDKRVVTAATDGTIKVWDVSSDAELFGFAAHPNGVNSIAISPDGKMIASSGYADPVVKLWDAADGHSLGTLPEQSTGVTRVIFAGSDMLTACDDGKIRLWKIGQDKPTAEFNAEQYAYTIAVSDDGHWLAAGLFAAVKLWNLQAPAEAPRVFLSFSAGVNGLAFNNNGSWLATAAADSTVKIWNVATGKEVRTLKGHTAAMKSVAFSPNGRSLVSASMDQTIRLWDLRQNAKDEFRTLPAGAARARFSADGRLIATAVTGTQTINIFDSGSLDQLRTIPSSATNLAFAPASHQLAVGEETGVIRVLDADTGKEVRSAKCHESDIPVVAFTPDGESVISGGSDHTVKLWDLAKGAVRTLATGKGVIGGLDVSSDGKYAAYYDNNQVGLYDLVADKELDPIPANGAYGLKFSPDASRLIVGFADGQMQCWDMAKREVVGRLFGHPTNVFDVAFSRDQRRLVSAGADYTLRVWDLDTWSELFTLQEGSTNFMSVSFSPDGRRLMTAGGNVSLWDAALLTSEGKQGDWSFFFQRAALHYWLRHWDQAAADLNQAIALQDGEGRLWFWRASAKGETGDLAGARKDTEEAMKRDFSRMNCLDNLALLAVKEGRADDYRAACEEMLRVATNTGLTSDLNSAGWACAYASGPEKIINPALECSERTVQASPNTFEYHNTHGALLYRAKRYEDAIGELNESMRLQNASATENETATPAEKATITVFDWLLLAMSHQQLGHTKEAQEWLEKATRSMDQTEFERSLEGNFSWNNRIEMEIFRREAEALIPRPAAAPSPTPAD